jgi:predicted PurR-regulated permease PerM
MTVLRSLWLWIGLLVLLLVYLLHPILSPFLMAFVLAYLGDPLADWLERRGLSRTGATSLVFVMFSLVLLMLLLVLVPMLGRQLMHLYALLPQVLDWLQQTAFPWLQQRLGLAENFWDIGQLKTFLMGQLGTTSDWLSSLLRHAGASGMAFLGRLADLLLVPVVSFYLLRDWDVLMQRLSGLLPRRQEPVISGLLLECHEVLGAFLRGQLLVMLALGVIYATGLMLVGLQLGLLIGVVAGLASIVPYMGFVVGIGSALTAALFQAGLEPSLLIGVVAVFAVGQLLEGMVLTPLLVGDRIGLHPVAVIFAIMAGGQLFGFSGVLLALPVAAVIMVLLRHVHDLYKLSDLYGGPSAGA